MRLSITAAALLVLSAPVFAAQPADGIYACTRGDVALGDIEITGLTFRDRAPGGEFGAPGEYVMLDDGTLFWLGDPAILAAGDYAIDTTQAEGDGFTVTVLGDAATDFETVACTPN